MNCSAKIEIINNQYQIKCSFNVGLYQVICSFNVKLYQVTCSFNVGVYQVTCSFNAGLYQVTCSFNVGLYQVTCSFNVGLVICIVNITCSSSIGARCFTNVSRKCNGVQLLVLFAFSMVVYFIVGSVLVEHHP